MFYFTLITLHLLATVVWVGGMLFLGLVLTPVLRSRRPDERASLLSAVGRRFLKIGWAALGALLVALLARLNVLCAVVVLILGLAVSRGF